MPSSGGASLVVSLVSARRRNSVSVTIQRLGHLGDAIAEGPIFIPRALPGEVVDGPVVEGRIAAPRILSPSSDRVSAPCRHYRGCGGCSLQHALDSFVATWKAGVVRSALEARGLSAPIRRMHTSPLGSRRRVTFTGRRTKKGATVGFHGPASDVIREVPGCLLVRPGLKAALPHLAEIVELTGSRKGEMRLSLTETDTGVDLAVTGGKKLDSATQQALIALANAAGFIRVAWDGETLVTAETPVLTFGTAPVTPPPGAFLQATRDGEAALQQSVSEALQGTKGAVVDLFSGIGTFTLPLARAWEIYAVEGDEDMLMALDHGWRHGSGLHKVSTECRDLFRRPLTADELACYDGVVIDPPRAGAEAQTAELALAQVPRIAFVSCNPVTFARDAALLTDAGYHLGWIDLVDQFRWSPHVELAACFSLF